MCDPVSFIITLAGSVLANVIADLISGQINAVKKTDIENRVDKQLEKDCKNENFNNIKDNIIIEVEILAKRYRAIEFTEDEIRLRDTVKKMPFVNNNDFIRKEISYQLDELSKIIYQRREEVKLNTKCDDNRLEESNRNHTNEIENGTIIWKQVRNINSEISIWEREIIGMEDRIRRRRSEGDK